MKLLSLSPSLTETLQALDVAHHLIGVTEHCPEVKPNIQRIGSPKALNLEMIEFIRPDLILSDAQENPRNEVEVLQKKFKVEKFEVSRPEEVGDAVWKLGKLMDKRDEAEMLMNQLGDALEKTRLATEGLEPIQTLVLLWNQPYLTINFDTYLSRLIEFCGAYNVFHQESIRQFPVEIEQITEKSPELILFAKPPFQKRHFTPLKKFKAFSKARLELIDTELLTIWGPRTLEALAAFGQILSVPAK